MGQMERRFDQPALCFYDSLEKVLFNSSEGISCEDGRDGAVEQICSHFGDDIDQFALLRQLACLQDARRSQTLPAMVEPTGELSSPVTIANNRMSVQTGSTYCYVQRSRKVIEGFSATAGHFSNNRKELRWLKTPQDLSADSHVTGAPVLIYIIRGYFFYINKYSYRYP